MLVALACLLLGIAAGSRSMLPLAGVSIAAAANIIPVAATPFAFLARAIWAVIASLGAVAELVGDKHPNAPSRRNAGPFGWRILSGAFCGAVVGASNRQLVVGAIAGGLGGVLGTLGGYDLRQTLARAFRRDMPAALTEDVIALVLTAAGVLLGAR